MAEAKAKALTQTKLLIKLLPVQGKPEYKEIDITGLVDGREVDWVLNSKSSYEDHGYSHTYCDTRSVEWLKTSIGEILDATIVNAKQREALGHLVDQEINRVIERADEYVLRGIQETCPNDSWPKTSRNLECGV